MHDKASEQIISPDALTKSLASQLRTCILALETKQADAVIGEFCTAVDVVSLTCLQRKPVVTRSGKQYSTW